MSSVRPAHFLAAAVALFVIAPLPAATQDGWRRHLSGRSHGFLTKAKKELW